MVPGREVGDKASSERRRGRNLSAKGICVLPGREAITTGVAALSASADGICTVPLRGVKMIGVEEEDWSETLDGSLGEHDTCRFAGGEVIKLGAVAGCDACGGTGGV